MKNPFTIDKTPKPLVYPKEIKPILDTLLSDSTDHNWLSNFYHKHIRQKVDNIVNHQIFGLNSVFTLKYPDSTPLERLYLLKAYFTRELYKGEKARDYLVPLKEVTRIRNIQALLRVLQNDLVRAIATQSEGVSLETQLHAKARVLLKHLIESEVLLMMRAKIDHLQQGKIKNPKLSDLNAWVTKELAQLCPVQDHLDLDASRFSLLVEQDSSQEFSWHNAESIWYFLNGANRLSLFIQHETLAIKRMQKRFWDNVKDLNRSVKEGKILDELLVYTPLKGLRFCWDIVKGSLLPYRFLRTLVNELHYLLSKMVEAVIFKPRGQYKTIQNGVLVNGLAGLAQLSIYVGLLLSFGLPVVPNPIPWLPNFISLFVPFSTLGYLITACTCSILTYTRDSKAEQRCPNYQAFDIQDLAKPNERAARLMPEITNEVFQTPIAPMLAQSKAPLLQPETSASTKKPVFT